MTDPTPPPPYITGPPTAQGAGSIASMRRSRIESLLVYPYWYTSDDGSIQDFKFGVMAVGASGTTIRVAHFDVGEGAAADAYVTDDPDGYLI